MSGIQFLALTGAGGGQLPFQRENAPQTITTHSSRDSLRLRGYEEKMRFFGGVHWAFAREEGDPLVTLNYTRAVTRKNVTWLIGRGIRIQVAPPFQHITKPICDEYWTSAEGLITQQELALTGSITGDGWLLVTPLTRGPLEDSLKPNSEKRVRVTVLASHQCFPVWDPLDVTRLLEFRIVAEVYDDSLPVAHVRAGHPAGAPYRAMTKKKFVQIIRHDTISYGWEGSAEGWTTEPNTLGEIPVAHFRNELFPQEPYGISDLDGLIDVQRELNEKATDLSDAVNYHSAPVTIITGAKAKSLEKGPKTLWSIPSPDARVENLQLGDMGPSHKYLEFVRTALFDLSGIPEGSLGRIQSISNTSAAALQVQFQPLIESGLRKGPLLRYALEKANYFIIRYTQLLTGMDLPVDFCATCGGRILERPVIRRNGKPAFTALGKPKMRRVCYHADPQTLEFMTPDEVKLKIRRKHSFGTELREVTFKQAKEEIEAMQEGENPSAWDTGKSAAETEKEQEKEAAEREKATPTSEPAADGSKPSTPPAPAEPEPSKVKGAVMQLSAKDIDLPEEPEEVQVTIRRLNPQTREWEYIDDGVQTLVPTGCENPRYADPYATKVTLSNPLPRDRAEETNLWKSWKDMGLVGRGWIRAHMEEDVDGKREDQDIADDIRFDSALKNPSIITDPFDSEPPAGAPAGVAPGKGAKGVAQTPGLAGGKPPPGKSIPQQPPGATGKTATPRLPKQG